jgi:hypothetical protein
VNGNADSGPPRSGAGRDSGLGDDALSRLEERLDRASEAAERLIADAAARALGKPPPAGWQQAAPEPPPSERAGARGASELELVLQVIGSMRDRIPPDLQRRLGEALREVLLALRALIDWYLERTERRRSEPVEVQDIPIS